MRKYSARVEATRRQKLIGYRKSGAPIFLVQGAGPELDPIEELEERNAEIAAELEELDKQIGMAKRSEQQAADWKKLEDELEANDAKIEEYRSAVREREERQKRVKAARAKWKGTQVKTGTDGAELYDIDMRSVFATGDTAEPIHRDLATRALKIVDDKTVQRHLVPEQRSRLEKVLRTKNGDLDGQLLAAYTIATSNPAYRSAFQKATGSLHPVFNSEEARAVSEVQALQRAMSVGTQAAGGFAVPVIIDPTIIMTAQGSLNPILARARVETITNDQWRGLTSAGVTWKFDAEAAPSNDNSPTIARPAIPTYRADGFIPFSIEIGQDWPGFAENMSEMLGSGYDELLADRLTNGTGANTPTGMISRLLAQTSPVAVRATGTAGTIAPADIYSLWGALPQRHRGKSTVAWMSSTNVQSAIRQLGTIDPNFTVDITQEAIPRMFGREYPMNDYMSNPVTTPATAAANLLVVGDFRGYLVAQRAGMNIEFVPMLFDITNNRPTGQRGWFAYARIGADIVDPTSIVMLANKTS